MQVKFEAVVEKVVKTDKDSFYITGQLESDI